MNFKYSKNMYMKEGEMMSRAKNKHIDPERLINLRKKMGFTQKTLSEKSNVTLSTIKRFERGEGYPNSLNLSDLSKCLRCDQEYLTGESKFINQFDKIDLKQLDKIKAIQGELHLIRYCDYIGCNLENLTSKREPTSKEIEQYKKAPPSERDSSIFADFSLQNELLNDSTEFIKCKYNELIKRKEDDLNEYEGSKND